MLMLACMAATALHLLLAPTTVPMHGGPALSSTVAHRLRQGVPAIHRADQAMRALQQWVSERSVGTGHIKGALSISLLRAPTATWPVRERSAASPPQVADGTAAPASDEDCCKGRPETASTSEARLAAAADGSQALTGSPSRSGAAPGCIGQLAACRAASQECSQQLSGCREVADQQERLRRSELAALEQQLAASTGRGEQLADARAQQRHTEARLEACGERSGALQVRLAEAEQAAGRAAACRLSLKACQRQLSTAPLMCPPPKPAACPELPSSSASKGSSGCVAAGAPCPLFAVSCLSSLHLCHACTRPLPTANRPPPPHRQPARYPPPRACCAGECSCSMAAGSCHAAVLCGSAALRARHAAAAS